MNISEIRDKIIAFWQGLTPGRRSALIAASAAILLGGIFLIQWLVTPKYAALFSDLQQRDAAAIVQKLKEMKVPYRLANGGTTIEVPEDQIYQLRLDLANAGVLDTTQGFELFDQNKLGMTDFERNLDYQRALQGELRRTIISLNEVEDARVHLVIPQPSVFLKEQQPPTAAVMLRLKPLAQLKPEQVRGIIELVVASVAGLKPENVRVIDMYGNVLSEGVIDNSSLPITRQHQLQLELKRQYERNLEQRLEAMLTQILGPGEAVAMVTADLDFDQQEIKETVWGKEGALRSEQIITEQGVAAGTGGSAGTVSNDVPVYQGNNPNNGNYSKSDTLHNYELDKTETKTVTAPGKVIRLSTAVAVDGPVDPKLRDQIEQIVTAAVGYQPERGDQIVVTSMTFDDSLQQQMAEEMSQEEQELLVKRKYFLWGSLALAGLFLLLLLIFLILRRRRSALQPETPSEPLVTDVPIEPLEVGPKVDPEKQREEAEREAVKERINDIVAKRPEDVALLLRAWMSEDQR
ncbi:MAG: flagellar M-ring protein FliF [Clostridia bacterium]|nr:flagellar M-ring protein FliF [Clostridia bacterium]